MEAFGALLWMVAFGAVAVALAALLLVYGTTPTGWARTSSFYVWSSVLTLPLPLGLRSGGDSMRGLWPLVLLAGVRHAMGVALFLLGAGLAVLAAAQKRAWVAIAVAAALNALVFLAVFFWPERPGG